MFTISYFKVLTTLKNMNCLEWFGEPCLTWIMLISAVLILIPNKAQGIHDFCDFR